MHGPLNLEKVLSLGQIRDKDQQQQVFLMFVNRDKDVDRRDHMTRQMNAFGLNYERFSALDMDNSAELLNRTFEGCGKRIWAQVWSKFVDTRIPVLACTLSHLSILKKLAQEVDPKRFPMALIVEDDVDLRPLTIWPLVVNVLSNQSLQNNQQFYSPTSGHLNSLLLEWLRAVVPPQWNIINVSPTTHVIHDVPPLFKPWIHREPGTVGYLVNMEGDWLKFFQELEFPLLQKDNKICRVADEIIYEILGGTAKPQKSFTSKIPLVLHRSGNSTVHKGGEGWHVTAARRSHIESWKRLFLKWFEIEKVV